MSRPGVRRAYRHTADWRGRKRAETLAITGGRCALCGDPGSDGQGKGIHQAHLVPALENSKNESAAPALPLCVRCHRSFDAGQKRGG